MKFLGSSTISTKNQITIPKQVVEKLDLQRGQQLLFIQDEKGSIYITTDIELPSKE